MLWPLPGGQKAWPVYRAEAAHIADGEGPAFDLGNSDGLAILAPADGVIVQAAFDPHVPGGFHAGNLCILATGEYRLHFCHMQRLEVAYGQTVARGDVIGHVGSTGTTYDAQGHLGTPGAAHLHLWGEKRLDGGGWARVWPSTLPWES